MKKLRKRGNIKALAHCLRQDLVKNICNISDADLYNCCFFGTKRMIEKYHNEIIHCIKSIYHADSKKISMANKMKFFAETK